MTYTLAVQANGEIRLLSGVTEQELKSLKSTDSGLLFKTMILTNSEGKLLDAGVPLHPATEMS